MRETAILASAVGTLLASIVDASTVQWAIEKRHHPKFRLGRRAAGTQQEDIANSVARGGYFATCSLGTPGQDVILQLDTGSSDIWVPWSEASICDAGEDVCNLGTFNPSASSTYDDFGVGDFAISYVDGSGSKGDYFRDAFTIADTTLSNLTMGLGKDTTIPYGLVGVGYTSNEAIISTKESLSAEYANLPALMMNEGVIATNAFSLWLNDLDASTGNILFGGIDTQKYIGNLTKMNIVKNSETNAYDSFIVAVTSVHAVSSSGTDRLTSSDVPINVVLDSGTTLSYLPNDIAEQIWEEVGATYSASYGLAVIPCRMQTSTGYFSFGFAGTSGPRINVTMDELVLDLVTQGSAPTFGSGKYAGEDACEFGIQNTTGTNLLGDTFLRSAYVVYDLVNNQVGLAQTDFNATESNVVAFANKGDAIPSATVASNSSLAEATPAFSQPAFVAQTGFSNGTESSAAARDVVMASGLTVAMAILGGTICLL